MPNHRQTRKWLIMGAVGSFSGLLTLLIFRSIPIASGTTALALIGLIVVKHVALALAVGSPFAAVLHSIKPALRAHCPWAPVTVVNERRQTFIQPAITSP